MRNALAELKTHMDAFDQSFETLEFIIIYKEVSCTVFKEVSYNDKEILIDSPKGHITLADIERLNFDYDAGYGGQELFGIVKYKDGTWATRGEYDGSEWWEYHDAPTYEEFKSKVNI